MKRLIKRVIQSKQVMMGDIPLDQPLPYPGIDQISPFLLLHHIQRDVKPGPPAFHVGAHPHRGFEPISFVFSGSVRHRDSRGFDSIIDTGGVQWMTAGKGIVHEEGLAPDFAKKGGWYEMIQLWVNLPARLKMTDPVYQGIQASEMPVVTGSDEAVRAQIVSGEFKGHTGPIKSLTGIRSAMVFADHPGEIDLNSDPGRMTLIYVLNGSAHINEEKITEKSLVWFGDSGTDISIKTDEKAQLLFLEGDAIDEPMASWGPYVMNSQTEIMEAMRDYQMGKMGVLT